MAAINFLELKEKYKSYSLTRHNLQLKLKTTSPTELAEKFLPLTLTGYLHPLKSVLTICLRKICAVLFGLQHF